ncbi:MerR family transcriptional regulator [Microbispora siamensis]
MRLYEQRGLLLPPPRTSSGQREYGPRDIARIRLVRQLLTLGLTIEGVARCADRLDLLEGDTPPPYGSPAAPAAAVSCSGGSPPWRPRSPA